MKKLSLSTLTALSLLSPALAQAPAPAALPASWNNAALSSATYVVLDAQVQGNPNLVNQEQMNSILAAMKRDGAGALQRHYPNAKIATDPNTPGAVVVQPILTMPGALVPWEKLTVRLDLQLPDGGRVALVDSFGLLTLWQQSWNAANYAADQLVAKMP